MATVALIHGSEDCGWAWHRVVDELGARGHTAVAPDLPIERDDADFSDYAATVGRALADVGGPERPLVVVGHSLGAFTAAIVAEREKADLLVLVAPMIPLPGESVAQWWDTSGYPEAARAQAEADGGLTGHDDPFVAFYNDVPRELGEESMHRVRAQSSAPMHTPLPLTAWPAPTRVVAFRDDRFLPSAFVRRLARDRLGVVADELPGGHCAPLSHPVELVDVLLREIG